MSSFHPVIGYRCINLNAVKPENKVVTKRYFGIKYDSTCPNWCRGNSLNNAGFEINICHICVPKQAARLVRYWKLRLGDVTTVFCEYNCKPSRPTIPADVT